MREVPDDSVPTRHSLLMRLKNWQDEASWREFFEIYWRLIYNFALKSRLTAAEAEEVVQETVIGVAKRIHQFKAEKAHGSFKSWLLTQTHWRILDQFRKRAKQAEAVLDATTESDFFQRELAADNEPESISPEIYLIWDAEWEEHLTRTALERVKSQASVRQFQMFDLHVLQGLSVRETARTLGASTAAVYMACSRLNRVLKAEMKLQLLRSG